MATRKKKTEVDTWPKITKGSHSVRTEYEDGTIIFEQDWDALAADVNKAIQEFEQTKTTSKRKTKV